MNKQEYMENFTKEQLVDRIMLLDTFFTQSNIFNFLQSDIESPLAKSIADNYESKIRQKDAKIEKLETEREELRRIRDCQVARANKLNSELCRRETVINQIDDILNELFGVTHGTDKEPEELKKILKIFINAVSTPTYELIPAEPIKLADFLINVKGEYERNAIGKAFYGNDKGTYNLFDVSELRQIAEHLLVYCNSQKEDNDE